MGHEIAEDYMSSLVDLDQQASKPMIEMLTMLAKDNEDYAPIIVDQIRQRIAQVYNLIFIEADQSKCKCSRTCDYFTHHSPNSVHTLNHSYAGDNS